MKHNRGWGFRGALVAAVSIFVAPNAHAQTAPAPAGVEAPGAALRRQVAQLAANPTSVAELVATGRAALAAGDADGALGFFTRARELAPRDGRALAGLASAQARTGRPETALLMFSEAQAAGAPEAEIAADRGLAHDLTGQNAQAQRDYLLSLRHQENAEVRRRLALSLAISGQRDAALRVIDAQVRGGDRAGQRAQVLVMALSGDVSGANAAARASLPAQASQALAPFITRLASLGPGDKASAANLGRVPLSPRPSVAMASAADPAALAFAGGGSAAPSRNALAGRLPVAPERSRSGGVSQAASISAASSQSLGIRASSRTDLANRGASAPAPEMFAIPHPGEPVRTADAAPLLPVARIVQPAAPARLGAGGPAPEESAIELASLQPTAAAAMVQPRSDPSPVEEPIDDAQANLRDWNSPSPVSSAAPAPVTPRRITVTPTPAATTPRATARQTRPPTRTFSDVATRISTLPAETPAARRTPAPAASTRSTTRGRAAAATTRPVTATAPVSRSAATRSTRQTSATRAPATSTRNATGRNETSRGATGRNASTRSATTRQAQTARHWVQLDASPNRAGFAQQVSRLRTTVRELRNTSAATVPVGSGRFRLLVGPFPTMEAAQAVHRALTRRSIVAGIYTSPAGTEVTPLVVR